MDISAADLERAANKLAGSLTHGELDAALARAIPEAAVVTSLLPRAAIKLEKARLLVEARGVELLSDRELRLDLVRGNPMAAGVLQPSAEEELLLGDLAGKAWHPGKAFAKRLCDALQLPHAFAGVQSQPAPDDLEFVEPVGSPPRLEAFQIDLIEQVVDLLEGRGGSAAMMSLPTGAGKTLTAMSAIIQFQDRSPDGVIFWLGTTEEICEQAVQTYLRLRKAIPPRRVTHAQRFWGRHKLDARFERGLIVASVQKLYARLDDDAIPHHLLKAARAVFFDEGHHAAAPTYLEAIRMLRGSADAPRVPLVGLTATPGRGNDPQSESNKVLVKEFEFNLLVPRLPGWDEPIAHLQSAGVLSRAEFVVLRTGRDFALTESMERHYSRFNDFGPEFLREVGADAQRNATILNYILADQSHHSGLIYGCSVSHAEHLAFLLRRQGRTAQCISSDTRPELRHRAIERFKSGQLLYLTNFGVLTTGFDAPATDLVVLARPVASQVLYEQMLGRGLRGPRFGGTERCTIVDFEDSVAMHGQPLAYRRFLSFWGAPAEQAQAVLPLLDGDSA